MKIILTNYYIWYIISLGRKHKFSFFYIDIWRCKVHPSKQKINIIPTHWRPHPDELVALKLALQFGEKMFSGTVTVEFYDAGIKTPDGKPVEKWIEKGFFPVGIWGY